MSAIYCGFDSDSAGENMANGVFALYPRVKRLRPTHHDWNDVLKSQSMPSHRPNSYKLQQSATTCPQAI